MMRPYLTMLANRNRAGGEPIRGVSLGEASRYPYRAKMIGTEKKERPDLPLQDWSGLLSVNLDSYNGYPAYVVERDNSPQEYRVMKQSNRKVLAKGLTLARAQLIVTRLQEARDRGRFGKGPVVRP